MIKAKGAAGDENEGTQDRFVTNNLDTLATELYVKTDDLLKASSHLAPGRPAVGIAPQLTDAELVTLAMMQAMLGFTSEARWLRTPAVTCGISFRTSPSSPAASAQGRRVAEAGHPAAGRGHLGAERRCVDRGLHPGGMRPFPRDRHRSDLAGWAEYGYCASHSRFFWGLRLHLVCALQGLPVAFTLTGAKADERETLVEQVNGTLMLHRRLARDYDHRPDNAASRVYWASTAGMLRRLTTPTIAWRDDVELAA